MIYDHIWRWKTRLPERKGQHCRVVLRGGRMNSVLVEFRDGQRTVTSRWAVKKRAPTRRTPTKLAG
jgi:hypothetical protein